jgi:hypothetical protein
VDGRPAEAYAPRSMATEEDQVAFDDAEVIADTHLAVLCEVGGREVWIPRSVLRIGTEVFDRGDCGALVVPRWFALEKGLVTEQELAAARGPA